MLDISTGEQIEALYKLIQIKGGKRVEKFQTTDINEALKYQKYHAKRFREGLLMEICPQKKCTTGKKKVWSIHFDKSKVHSVSRL